MVQGLSWRFWGWSPARAGAGRGCTGPNRLWPAAAQGRGDRQCLSRSPPRTARRRLPPPIGVFLQQSLRIPRFEQACQMHPPSTVFALDDDSGTDIQPSGSDSDLTSFSIVKTITDGNTPNSMWPGAKTGIAHRKRRFWRHIPWSWGHGSGADPRLAGRQAAGSFGIDSVDHQAQRAAQPFPVFIRFQRHPAKGRRRDRCQNHMLDRRNQHGIHRRGIDP